MSEAAREDCRFAGGHGHRRRVQRALSFHTNRARQQHQRQTCHQPQPESHQERSVAVTPAGVATGCGRRCPLDSPRGDHVALVDGADSPPGGARPLDLSVPVGVGLEERGFLAAAPSSSAAASRGHPINFAGYEKEQSDELFSRLSASCHKHPQRRCLLPACPSVSPGPSSFSQLPRPSGSPSLSGASGGSCCPPPLPNPCAALRQSAPPASVPMPPTHAGAGGSEDRPWSHWPP